VTLIRSSYSPQSADVVDRSDRIEDACRREAAFMFWGINNDTQSVSPSCGSPLSLRLDAGHGWS